MYKHYQDALAICRVHGNPQYFITFTCNVKWPEIRRYIAKFPNLKAEDRPDVIARVFHMKVTSFVNFLKVRRPFGKVTADLYTIEFQKRGLPHCHLLLWVDEAHKIKDAAQLDNYISAEIPDPIRDPTLYTIVTDTMIHGPCGIARPNSPCMALGSCKKNFPKDYEPFTRFDDNGYARYRRRQSTHSVQKNGISLDNGYVVPYNRSLLLHFHAHINVEYCGWSMLIKYLFKYISKGTDCIKYTVKKTPTPTGNSTGNVATEIDEIKDFVDDRFICPHESAWRIFNFMIHERNPSVQTLSVHLENRQNVTFKDNEKLQNVLRNPNARRITLTEWLKNNCEDDSGLHLRYIDYLSEYRWESTGKCWLRRITNKTPAIGRLVYIHPSAGEAFYLRMLLSHQKGCKSFIDIRTIAGEILPTYRTACEKLGLLGDDNEWSLAIEEAATWANASELRSLFTHMLLFCEMSNPKRLFDQQWKKMSDDASYIHGIVNDEDQMQYVLYEIELLLHSGTPSTSLSDYGLPMPTPEVLASLTNRLLMEEKNYNRQILRTEHESFRSSLHPEQTHIYEHVITTLALNRQVLAFVYGHGGTGKTFLWKTIIARLRSDGKIVLAVAASGIASLLLPSGRTAHSRFKIPIDLTDESLCYIKKKTQLAQLLIETSLIVWDEAPMNDRRCFESLDKSLKDLLGDCSRPFGGKSVLLGGDFRQTLPVKPKASKTEILNSALPRSYLWRYFRVYKLSENMRLQRPNMDLANRLQVASFSAWLLKVGDGVLGTIDDDDPLNTKQIEIPSDYMIPPDDNAIKELTQFIYDSPTLENPTAENLSGKAIVCPKNHTVDEINTLVLGMAPGDSKTYLSVDSIIPRAGCHGDIDLLYPTEYLAMLNFTGLPPHELQLKVNAPVILIRNINQTSGLCNGTRMLVTQLLSRVIEAQIMTGGLKDNKLYTNLRARIWHFLPSESIPKVPIPLHIRVIKKWKTQTMDYLKSQTTDQDLCYLFVDKHGAAIEATANPKKETYFDSKLKIGSCYKVGEYISTKSREYMKVVPHDASLRLGTMTTFEPLHDNSIPTYYYNFATYDMLASRKAHPRPLTDYIGRVETVSPPLRRACKNIIKVKIQDEWKNVIEITFWMQTMFPYEKEKAVGQLLAVTATIVTTFQDNLQLESTDATTAVLNPPIPELQSYIYKFSKLERSETVGQRKPVLPIAEIKAKYRQDTTRTKFTCKATVTEITADRKWFYVTCPKCKGKVHLQRAEIPRFVCEDDGHVPNPTFMYCVNTTIEDESDEAKAVFFNEAMEQMLEKSCYDMVVEDGHTDPETTLADIYKIRGKTAVLDISMKQDNSMAVNKVEVPPAIIPSTPDPKTATTKRSAPDSPDDETTGKQAKK